MAGSRSTHLRGHPHVQYHQLLLPGSRFPAREVFDLYFSRCEIQSVKSWGPHYLHRSQIGVIDPYIAIETILLTFGPNVQICSEAKWTNGDVGRDSQRGVSLGGFERFLGSSVKYVTHPCPGVEAETKMVVLSAKPR